MHIFSKFACACNSFREMRAHAQKSSCVETSSKNHFIYLGLSEFVLFVWAVSVLGSGTSFSGFAFLGSAVSGLNFWSWRLAALTVWQEVAEVQFDYRQIHQRKRCPLGARSQVVVR
jgi:hypothetical protein